MSQFINLTPTSAGGLLDKYKINFTESTEQCKNINTRALVFKASETV